MVKGDLGNRALHAATAAMIQASAYSNASIGAQAENKENVHVEGMFMLYWLIRDDFFSWSILKKRIHNMEKKSQNQVTDFRELLNHWRLSLLILL